MKIGVIDRESIDASVQEQVSELFRQLSPNKRQLDLHEILAENNNVTIAYCEDEGKLVGIALMCTYRVISGYKAWVEDVVVDKDARGKGIGRMLMNQLLEVAKEKQLTEVLLFTEDHRQPAINLYQSLGFKQKESRIYLLKNGCCQE